MVLEKTLESPLDCKEFQLVHSKRDQPWVFFSGYLRKKHWYRPLHFDLTSAFQVICQARLVIKGPHVGRARSLKLVDVVQMMRVC